MLKIPFKSFQTAMAAPFRVLSLALLLAICVSCRHEKVADPADPSGNDMIVRIVIPSALPASPGSSSLQGGFEDGAPEENHIDVLNSCRVLFFSTANTFIGTLDRQSVADIAGSGYREYDIVGVPPEGLPADFRIMVAANWPDMSAIDQALPGFTTLDDICHAAESQFEPGTGFSPDPETGALIPFYGIRLYTGMQIQPGVTILPGAIGLLRALARIEVSFDNASTGIPDKVELCGYNTKGYCAPSAVYSQDDYGDGTDWENDYLHRLHIPTPDNGNESGAASRRVCMTPLPDGNGCRWRIYVPEYRNVLPNGTTDPTEARIEFHLPSQSPSDPPFILYFADYTGATSASTSLTRFNIERNNIYRFQVSMQQGKLVITTPPWNYRPQPEITL